MKKPIFIFVAILVAVSIHAQEVIPGFNRETSSGQIALEATFDQKVNTQNLDQWMKYMSSHPHELGSPFNHELTGFIAGKFRSWGYTVKIDTYYVLFPTPKVRNLEMVSPVKYKAVLAEPKLKEDATSGQISEQLPTYNAYSADGNVEAEVVYVNYGVKKDYEELERLGVSVRGKIVIARYLGSWRGIKPKLAAEHGAIGCIIYSDPRDDGYFQGDVYPEGAFRNSMGVQRGSVMDMPVYPGDPLTPGYGATKDAQRLDRSEAKTLVKIPVLPISWHDAQPILSALEGQVCPETWRGALPITYHVGPGPAKVRLNLQFNWDIKPCYDVIATLEGSRYPDQWIVRGNHYDAWVNGAADPISGAVALLEEARIIGELAKAGNRPERTIKFCAWDGEEPGLIGSTEWVEDHADELRQKAVAYINTDGNERGFLFAAGSHSLKTFMQSVAGSVSDPERNVSVLERQKAFLMVKNGKDKFRGFQLEALGSGSDYTPFLQHLGVSSLNIFYGGEGDGGEYHSIYDSYDDYTRFKDPGFQYGAALVKTDARIVLRLANAGILPYNFVDMDSTITGYVKELMALNEKMRKDNNQTNYLLDHNYYTLAADPTREYHAPEKKEIVPYLNFALLQNALVTLHEKTQAWSKIDFDSLNRDQMEKYNGQVFQSERSFISDQGLPGRPWFRHELYAPGLYTGYGVKTMPGIREAIEEEHWEQAQQQIDIMTATLNRYSEEMQKIIDLTSEK